MKNITVILTAFFLIMNSTLITAQEDADNAYSGVSEKHINVEISDEAAVIIDGRRITLSEAIIKAIELNPDIYITGYDAAMTDTDQKKFDSKYSLVFKTQGGISSVTNPEFLYSDNGKKNNSADISASLSKVFSSGTTVSAGVSQTYSKFESGTGQQNNINNPSVFLSVEQELLKNAFGYNDRKQYIILKNSTQEKRDAHLYSISLIALKVMTDYWNVVIAQNHLENSRVMLGETLKVRKIVAGKVNAGLSEKYEINYWNSLAASARSSVTQAEQNYRKIMRKFLRDINIDKTITLQERVILTDKLPVINTETSIKTAFEKRADYLNAVRSLDNAKMSLQINENNSLPSLKGSVSVTSLDYNTGSAGDAYSNTSEMKYPSYEAKLSMTYPLYDTGQKAEERNAMWSVEQSKMKLEMTRKIVKDDVTTSAENIGTGYQLYGEAKESRKQAEMYYRNILINMKRGRIAASSVRDALDSLVNSREMELQRLVEYNVSLIEFEVSKNELFEAYNIDINRYIPSDVVE